MKRIFRCTAIATIAVSLAPLITDSSIFSSNKTCTGGNTVCVQTRGMAAVPPLVLWAWERPEDLRFINPRQTGVAFLAGTVRLGRDGMSFRPRLQPLRVARETRLVAVVRIEVAANSVLDAIQADKVAAAIAGAAEAPQVVAAQVDFDATVSERAFYRELLLQLRRQLPVSTPISITALTSWCIGDRWLAGLPVDEAVPMLFRMGTGQSEVSNWMRAGRDFREPVCQTSLGISLDEPWRELPAGRRVYAFSPSRWTERSLQTLYREMQSWR